MLLTYFKGQLAASGEGDGVPPNRKLLQISTGSTLLAETVATDISLG